MDNLGVIVGERCHCDLDMVDRLLFVPQIGHLIQSLLHLVLNPVTEGSHARFILDAFLIGLFRSPVRVLLDQEVVEEVWIDIKLDGVITGGDSFDIPLDVIILLDLLDIVEIENHEERHEDGQAAKPKCTYLPLNYVVRSNLAPNL